MKRIFLVFLLLMSLPALFAQTHTRHKADALLKKKAECLGKHKRDVYYYIQIYNGKDLSKAKARLKEFIRLYPNAKAFVTWENPEYKVWTGQYDTKFEAEQAWLIVKEHYPDALIVYPRKH